MSPEEAKARAEELMKKAREKRALEDKEKAAEAERERIRRNKELLEAKRKEEDQERMRNIMFRQREKEELERAKEEMRRKLEYDRKERRKALGLPEELTEEEKVRGGRAFLNAVLVDVVCSRLNRIYVSRRSYNLLRKERGQRRSLGASPSQSFFALL